MVSRLPTTLYHLNGNRQLSITTSSIRPAQPADLEQLLVLLRLLFSIEKDFDFNVVRQRRGLEMMLAHDGAIIMVVESEKKVIGVASGQLTISTAVGGPALLVEDVVVDEAFRGQGFGKSLLEALAMWARNRKIERMQLLADRNNVAAGKFYNALGWQETDLTCRRRSLSSES